jgi:aryl-alcohol dehydrogenase-like predicted oxidoreductase
MTPSIQARIPATDPDFVDIPETQLKVSRVALGTSPLGGREEIDVPGSIATIRAAIDQGINLIDTAPVYGFGLAERIVGAALEGRRTQAVIATKAGLEWSGGTVYRNASRARIMQAIDDSLRRLRTDYIDIYQLHWADPLVPLEETAEAMCALHEQGRIRAIGVSNLSVAEIERFRRVAPLHVVQFPYNLFERTSEAELLPYCHDHDIVTFGSNPLCRGLLSGSMRPATIFKGDDLRRIDPKFQPPHFTQYVNAVRQLDGFAQRRFSPTGGSSVGALDARPRHQRCALGRPSPRASGCSARCRGLVAQHCGPDVDRADHEDGDRGSRRSRDRSSPATGSTAKIVLGVSAVPHRTSHYWAHYVDSKPVTITGRMRG